MLEIIPLLGQAKPFCHLSLVRVEGSGAYKAVLLKESSLFCFFFENIWAILRLTGGKFQCAVFKVRLLAGKLCALK